VRKRRAVSDCARLEIIIDFSETILQLMGNVIGVSRSSRCETIIDVRIIGYDWIVPTNVRVAAVA